MDRIIKRLNGLSREVAEVESLEVFKQEGHGLVVDLAALG